ncbi:hypothetical protein KFE25_004793 [Diacronema lutheri]|uniref:SRCR domain-containing protein n=1 Tax=Diacronema lutheri TaxID=2081491 RepID=A0A8J6C671_DIALT|nr:hypothetical protein KFE25_004793 [Diacronema lutheri]
MSAPDFAAWKATYAKTYLTPAEDAEALANFMRNSQLIANHNAQPLAFSLGHNQFSDMSPIEFRDRMLTPDLERRKIALDLATKKKVAVHKKGDYGMKEMLPQAVDWVAMGGVSPVEDQGMCAGSWAFASAAAMESASFIAGGMKEPLQRLSRQQLLDCDHGAATSYMTDHGCHGGLPDKAFGWTSMHGGLCTEADYPFLSSQGRRYDCRVLSCEPSVTVAGYKDVAHLDEDALQDAVAQQPVAAAISASHPVFQLYKSGVFDHPLASDGALDHVVLIVGYGTTDAGVNYWKLKNSWGTTWGMDGYVLLRRNVNMAGIASMPAYPIGVGAPEPKKLTPAEEVHQLGPHIHGPDMVPQPTAYDGNCHTPVPGDVKLTAYPSGHVLMWYDGEWHTVCQQAANAMFAQVVCKMLGFKRVVYQGDVSAPQSYPMVSSPHCIGNEESLMACRFDPTYKDQACSTYRNMLAMYVTCANGEMSNYTYHCGFKSPGAALAAEMPSAAAPRAIAAGAAAPLIALAVAALAALALAVGARSARAARGAEPPHVPLA